MDLTTHTRSEKLEYYSFIWSLLRLVIAAVALFIGGIPVLRAILPVPALTGVITIILIIAWIISGVAALYLLYRWYKNAWRIFGGKNRWDSAALAIMIISGLNLGLTGLFGSNPGMTISTNRVLFIIVAILYLLSAGYLLRRWKENGRRLF
jgi:uncharacterized membrane protein YuzA (DUF378 family)